LGSQNENIKIWDVNTELVKILGANVEKNPILIWDLKH